MTSHKARGDRRELAAQAFGMDYAEIGQYRYQPSTFRPPVYAVGDHYVFVGTDAERDLVARKLGLELAALRDAFLQSRAQEHSWTVWVAAVED